jgi:tellurite resistance protein
MLNDGSEWQIEKLLKEDNPEFAEILERKSAIVSERFAENMAVEAAKIAEQVKIEETRSGRDIITVMAQLLLADGVIDDAEMKFINEMAKRYHMPPEALEGVLEAVKAGEIHFLKPKVAKEALDILKGAVSMAFADGVLAPEEEAALESVAKELGYSAIDVKRLVKAEEKLRRQTRRAPLKLT